MNITEVRNLEDFMWFRLATNCVLDDIAHTNILFYWLWKAGMATIVSVEYRDKTHYSFAGNNCDRWCIAFQTDVVIRTRDTIVYAVRNQYYTTWEESTTMREVIDKYLL